MLGLQHIARIRSMYMHIEKYHFNVLRAVVMVIKLYQNAKSRKEDMYTYVLTVDPSYRYLQTVQCHIMKVSPVRVLRCTTLRVTRQLLDPRDICCGTTARRKLLSTDSYSPTHGVVTPPSSSGKLSISPVSTKLSIDFLVNPLSRSSSIGDKAPIQQQMQVPTLRPITQLANPFTSATMGCNPRYGAQVLGNQRSLLSFLEPHAAAPSYPAPQPQYAAVPGHFQTPVLPSLTMYR
ncbi:uncharacterized protein KRP23_11206 [Phytophthora ramorum]|uniref:uncharacterized protein n=1 Tax=Phytophthora ramorum TaxID=164328 RepID=UPI0030A5A105|nr:hypothetical protein KRP23_11206 [Phytophthora ramorum]